MPRTLLLALSVALLVAPVLRADDKPAPRKTVEKLAEQARKSVVMITFTGRDGKRQGLGTGFVVSADGLIATNLHVLGEGRAIAVQLADGKSHAVTSIHASDRALDLALIRINVKNLTPLELGDSDGVKLGQSVVALGNPRGLEYSVVSGVVSGRRTIGGTSMIQLAIPLEPGNSGGPLLDRQGRVQGILTLKSLVTDNLGFAMPINALKPLMEKPNPIPIAHWITIGALDARDWQPLLGARWRQRAGRILVDGAGSGFGGRALCLAKREPPPVPFEVAVTVKLDDESGAAGLVWNADGGNKHYAFYPSGGKLRLTRFAGPDVFSWKVLHDKKNDHYHPGDWNTVKVRVEKDKTLCYINDHLVVETSDKELTGGKVGLAKFRETRAEFKNFRVAREIPPARLAPEVVARIQKVAEKLRPRGELPSALVDSLVPDAAASVEVLQERARLLEQQAAQLRKFAAAVHARKVQAELVKELGAAEDKIDLFRAALLIALLDNPELDVVAYQRQVDRLGRELAARLPKGADDSAKLSALRKFLFQERGYHASRVDYYTRANSYLNEVLDDREGIPITLSVLYMELARRIGLPVVGVGMPGHFIVKYAPAKGPEQLIDVYEGGKPMTREEANKIVEGITRQPLRDEHLAAVTKRAIIVRMLQNLYGVAQKEKDAPAVLRYLDTVLAVSPSEPAERWMRAVFRAQEGQRQGALEDIDWLLKKQPPNIDLRYVRQLRQLLLQQDGDDGKR
jgi:regulator of sirC expression with transglutaminase-like and TPR domain